LCQAPMRLTRDLRDRPPWTTDAVDALFRM